MPISEKPWGSFAAADYTQEQWCRACLIDMNAPGAAKTKAMCRLPIHEPDGTLNRNALGSAASVLAGGRGGVDAPPEARRMAARKLMTAYREAEMGPPESIRRMAGT